MYLNTSKYKHTHTMWDTVILMKIPVPLDMIISVVELHSENIFQYLRLKFSMFQISEVCLIYHKMAIYHNKSGNELLMTGLFLLMWCEYMSHPCASQTCHLLSCGHRHSAQGPASQLSARGCSASTCAASMGKTAS